MIWIKAAHGLRGTLHASGRISRRNPAPAVHYPGMPNMQVRVNPRGRHLELIAITGVVTAPKLNRLTDALAAAIERYPARDLLVEVRAQSRDFPLLEVFAVLAHAARSLAAGTRIAYVVTGRPVPSVKRFYEELADRRNLAFRMFAARREALEWLDARQEAAAH